MSTHKHHRRRRSQGGDDSWGNIIELPSEIHELVHREPEIAYQHGLLVHSHDNPADIRPDVAGFMQSLGIESQPAQQAPKRPRLERTKAKSVSIRLPEGVTGADWDTLLEEAEAVEQSQLDTQYEQYRGGVARGKLIWCVLERFTGRV